MYTGSFRSFGLQLCSQRTILKLDSGAEVTFPLWTAPITFPIDLESQNLENGLYFYSKRVCTALQQDFKFEFLGHEPVQGQTKYPTFGLQQYRHRDFVLGSLVIKTVRIVQINHLSAT